jgi:hypothetical protein
MLESYSLVLNPSSAMPMIFLWLYRLSFKVFDFNGSFMLFRKVIFKVRSWLCPVKTLLTKVLLFLSICYSLLLI